MAEPAVFRVPLTRPWIPEGVADDFARVLASGFLTEGEETAGLEREVEAFLGVGHAIAVTSATTGLELALWADEIGPGDEVIVPDFTYPATASAVARVGATAVLVDVDPRTMNVSAPLLEAACSEKTRALMPVSLFGNPLESDAIEKLARERGLLVIEDAACSLGAAYRGRRVGGLARSTVFSLHPRKFVTSGEGGLVCTDDDALAGQLRSLKRFGMEEGRFVRMGTNAKLSNLQAVLARAQLRHVEALLTRRRDQVGFYREHLHDVAGVELPVVPPGGEHGWQSFVVQVRERDRIRDALRGAGIEVQIGTFALHREPAFKPGPQVRWEGPFSGSEHAADQGLALPLFHELGQDQQEEVATALTREIGA